MTNHKIIAIFTPLKGIIGDISVFQPVENSFLPVSSQKRPKSAWQARFQLIQHCQTPAKIAYRVENSPFLWKTHALQKQPKRYSLRAKNARPKRKLSSPFSARPTHLQAQQKKKPLLQSFPIYFRKNRII